MAVKVGQIKAQCKTLADDLLHTGAASAEAVARVMPGGDDNPAKDGSGWLRCYGQLQLLRGRAQGHQRIGGGGAEATTDDSVTLTALAGTPGVAKVFGKDRAVYPKSMSALLACHARDVLIGKLSTLIAGLKDVDANDQHADLVHEAVAELDYQLQLLCWIATCEGPGLPFPSHERRPELPAEFATLDPLSVLEINRVFARVNWVNIRAMEAFITPDPDAAGSSQRPGWSPFFGALAMELHEDPTTLIEHRPLVSVMASTSLAASARRSAMLDAKRDADVRREARD